MNLRPPCPRPIVAGLLVIASVLLCGCGFYLRGSEFNGVNGPSRWVKIISPQKFSADLLRVYRDLCRGVPNLVVNLGGDSPIASLPPINVTPSTPSTASTPSNIATPSSQTDATRDFAAAQQSQHWLLSIVNEKLDNYSNITDSTTINQQVRLTYRLTYRLQTPDGTLWQEADLEHRAEVSFSEAERLSSENKVAQIKQQLYLEMARHLLQISLSARPTVPINPSATTAP